MKKAVPALVPEGITLNSQEILERFMRANLVYKKYSGILPKKMYDMQMDSFATLLGLTEDEKARCRALAEKLVEEAEKTVAS